MYKFWNNKFIQPLLGFLGFGFLSILSPYNTDPRIHNVFDMYATGFRTGELWSMLSATGMALMIGWFVYRIFKSIKS